MSYINKSYLMSTLKDFKEIVLDGTYVSIKYTTESEYNSLATKNEKTLYVFDDVEGETHLYLGEKELSSEDYSKLEMEIKRNAGYLKSSNLFNKYDIDKGGYLNLKVEPYGYVWYSDKNFFCPRFIEIESNETYIVSGVDICRVIFYDSDKAYIGTIDDLKTEFITPSNAKYIRFNMNNAFLDTFKLEKGKTPTPYEEFAVSNLDLAKSIDSRERELLDLRMLGWVVPEECPIHNYVDVNGYFHQLVGRVNLGTLNWSDATSYDYGITKIADVSDMITIATEGHTLTNLYCRDYPQNLTNDYNPNSESYVNCIYGVNNSKKIGIVLPTSVAVDSLNGKYLYYELATPRVLIVEINAVVSEKLGRAVYNEGTQGWGKSIEYSIPVYTHHLLYIYLDGETALYTISSASEGSIVCKKIGGNAEATFTIDRDKHTVTVTTDNYSVNMIYRLV